MPIRTSRIQMKHIKPGKKLWVAGYSYNNNWLPTLIIAKEIVQLSHCKIVRVDCHKDQRGKFCGDLYPGDSGVRPENYDNRPTQVFNTKKACQRAIDSWKGQHPNFLEGL